MYICFLNCFLFIYGILVVYHAVLVTWKPAIKSIINVTLSLSWKMLHHRAQTVFLLSRKANIIPDLSMCLHAVGLGPTTLWMLEALSKMCMRIVLIQNYRMLPIIFLEMTWIPVMLKPTTTPLSHTARLRPKIMYMKNVYTASWSAS